MSTNQKSGVVQIFNTAGELLWIEVAGGGFSVGRQEKVAGESGRRKGQARKDEVSLGDVNSEAGEEESWCWLTGGSVGPVNPEVLKHEVWALGTCTPL